MQGVSSARVDSLRSLRGPQSRNIRYLPRCLGVERARRDGEASPSLQILYDKGHRCIAIYPPSIGVHKLAPWLVQSNDNEPKNNIQY